MEGHAVATGSSTYNLAFNYTADGSNGQYGNMTCHYVAGQTVGLCPQWTFSSSTNRITSSGFVYDAAGNLTTDASGATTRNYGWDAEGRLTQVTDNGGGTSTTYTYNALGQRAELITTGWQLEQIFDTLGQRVGYYAAGSGANYWDAAYVPWGGLELAEYSTGTTFAFQHRNALGSASMSTLASGAFGGDVLFYPWGQEWLSAGGMYDTHFAGTHASLQGSGQIDFTMDETPFRFFASNLGRWHSPDPMGGDITNPQSLNLYAYALNNPMSLVDPSGLGPYQPCESEEDCPPGDCLPDIDPTCIPTQCDPVLGCEPPWGGNGSGSGGGSSPPPPNPIPPGPVTGPIWPNGGIGNSGFPQSGMPITSQLPWPIGGTLPCDFGACVPIWNPFTLQVGISGGWTFPWGINVAFFFGLAIDFHGHVAAYHGGGAGAGAGARGSVGVQLAGSNADTVCGLGGPFMNASGTIGAEGATATADIFQGKGNGPGGTVTGGGVTIGVGGGASGSMTVTGTTVTPIASVPCH